MFWRILFFVVTIYLCQTTSANDGWKKKKADIYFLFDSSNSVWRVDYELMRDIVSDLVGDMDIGPNATRVGVGIFNNYHKVYIPMDKYTSKVDLQNAIKDAPRYYSQIPYLSKALYGMRTEGFAHPRKDVPKIGVLITDGRSRLPQYTYDNSTMVKKEGIFMFVIGIGKQVDQDELSTLASSPKRVFYHHLDRYGQLENLKPTLSLEMSKVEVLKQSDSSACGSTKPVDVVFVFDEFAMGTRDSSKIRSFITELTSNMDMNSGNIRAAVMSKSCPSGDDIWLEQYLKTDDFSKALAENDNKQPAIIKLMEKGRIEAFHVRRGARDIEGVKQRIVLVVNAELSNFVNSDSRQKQLWARKLLMQGRRAKHSDIEVYVIAVTYGSSYDKRWLNYLAWDENHVTYFDSGDDFDNKEKRQTFRHAFCKDI